MLYLGIYLYFVSTSCRFICIIKSSATAEIARVARNTIFNVIQAVLSKVDEFATFKKVEVHAKNSTF